MKFLWAFTIVTLVLLSGCAGENGANGKNGVTCEVTDNSDGTATVKCGDKSFTIASGKKGDKGDKGIDGKTGLDGKEGAAGKVGTAGTDGKAGNDGKEGVAGKAGKDGVAGKDGKACTMTDDGAGNATLTCGSQVFKFTDPAALPAGYKKADGIKGGTAYSKWWYKEGGGTGTQPGTVKSDFLRCKACHGWDGFGNGASYADRTGQSTGKSSRPDVASINLRNTVKSTTPGELYDLITNLGGRDLDATSNSHPDFTNALTDAQKWNFVKFMREEWVDPSDLYDWKVTGAPMHWQWDPTIVNADKTKGNMKLVKPTITYSNIGKGGDIVNGQKLWDANCKICHGADGKMITNVDGKTGVGMFLRQKPHEAWFKIKFGVPGAKPPMAPGLVTDTKGLRDLYLLLTDKTKFPD